MTWAFRCGIVGQEALVSLVIRGKRIVLALQRRPAAGRGSGISVLARSGLGGGRAVTVLSPPGEA
jgi:hypothetical protein